MPPPFLLACISWQHGHKPIHAVIDKVALDATDQEIPPRLCKRHDFHPVLPKRTTQVQRLQTRIQAQGDRILSCPGEHHQQVVFVEPT
jgi:hypothetical protein